MVESQPVGRAGGVREKVMREIGQSRGEKISEIRIEKDLSRRIEMCECLRLQPTTSALNKAGYTATLVACGWEGAVFELLKHLGKCSEAKDRKNIKKSKMGTNRPTNQPTNRPTD